MNFMVKWYAILRTIKLIYERIYFIIKYIICNTKFGRWYAWAYSKYTHRIYIIVDVDDLHKELRLVDQFDEGYVKQFEEPLRRFISQRYHAYNHDSNYQLSQEFQKKIDKENLKKGV